jgi:uncharacterized protein with HEPN domain
VTDPRLQDRLDHILEAITKIQRYVKGMDASQFANNELVQDAVIRNFGIIGEASNAITVRFPEFAAAHPELELSEAYQMRNVVAHGYFGVRLETVWDTIQQDLPVLMPAVRAARDGLASER